MDVTRSVKYGTDQILALVLLVLLSPFLLLVAIAIRLDSPGSPWFLQERMGLRGRPFTIFKFRTMRVDPEKEKLDFALRTDDARITRIGAFLRRTGIDEIPQLINIFLGEMSFIGPRPTLRSQVETYTPRQSRRLLFRPGLTGLAQVHGRNGLSWEERIEMDLHYVEHFSLWLDLKILCRTPLVVFRGEGVYAKTSMEDDSPAGKNDGSMKKLPLIVIGTGGHARVLIDAIEQCGRFEIVGLVEDISGDSSQTLFGYPFLGGRETLQRPQTPHRAVVAIDSPLARGAWMSHLTEQQFELPCVVHPTATVGRDVTMQDGTVLLAGSIVNAGARLGRGVIINTGASVDHDCVLADLVHLAPGARLAGNVRVGSRSHIGIGACVIQNIDIGADAILGAGAAVVSTIPAGATAVGVPARVIRVASASTASSAQAPKPSMRPN